MLLRRDHRLQIKGKSQREYRTENEPAFDQGFAVVRLRGGDTVQLGECPRQPHAKGNQKYPDHRLHPTLAMNNRIGIKYGSARSTEG